jgi:hypothetical protein
LMDSYLGNILPFEFSSSKVHRTSTVLILDFENIYSSAKNISVFTSCKPSGSTLVR